MLYHYAKDVAWGELQTDDTVEVTFNLYDAEGSRIAENLTVKGIPSHIQQFIIEKVQSKSASISAYNDLVTNTEFKVEMVQEG